MRVIRSTLVFTSQSFADLALPIISRDPSGLSDIELDSFRVAPEGEKLVSGFRVPHPGDTIPAPRKDPRPVGTEFLAVTGLTVKDFHLLVRLKVFNTEHMNQAVFAFRRYEDASLRYTGVESHEGLSHIGLYDTVVARG